MDRSARVADIQSLRAFRTSLLEFKEVAQNAIGEANSEVIRTLSWLQNDRGPHWKGELKRRNARLSDAKAELMRAEIASRDSRATAVVERKAVARWKAAVEEAEEKLRAIKRWLRVFDREVMLFKAGCQSMSGQLEAEVPKAVTRLDRLFSTLEGYTKIVAPSIGAAHGHTTGESSVGSEATSDDEHDQDDPGEEQ